MSLQSMAMREAERAQKRRKCERATGHVYKKTGEDVFPDGRVGDRLECTLGCGAVKIMPPKRCPCGSPQPPEHQCWP